MAENYTYENQALGPWQLVDPPKHLPYEFEKIVDFNNFRTWSKERMPLIYALCVAYFIFVQIGPLLMKNRKPFNLQKPLVLWNFLLAVFSIMGVIRTTPTFFDNLLEKPNGVYRLSCVSCFPIQKITGLSQPFAFWIIAFCVSKLFEFVDTIFIVLRKKPLIFLHWFHHLTMFYGVFLVFIAGEPFGAWAVVINYTIHSVMYTYYTLMSLRIKVPQKVSMVITALQILQMATVFILNAYTFRILANGGECLRTSFSIKYHVAVAGTYWALFTKLFYNSYIAKSKKKIA